MLQHQMLQFALLGAGWVLWLLVGLSVLCIAIAIERAIYFLQNTAPRAGFEDALTNFLGGGDRKVLEGRLRGMKGFEPRIILAGLAAAEKNTAAAEDAMAGTVTFERLRLERGLIVIGTVASNAPYVGLFGTVLGIIQAFHDLSLGSEDSAMAVMAGISEALVSTAVGLMVAIPAVVMYNYFNRRLKDVIGRAESIGQLVVSRLTQDEAA